MLEFHYVTLHVTLYVTLTNIIYSCNEKTSTSREKQHRQNMESVNSKNGCVNKRRGSGKGKFGEEVTSLYSSK